VSNALYHTRLEKKAQEASLLKRALSRRLLLRVCIHCRIEDICIFLSTIYIKVT